MQRGTSKQNIDVCIFKTEGTALQMIRLLENCLLEEFNKLEKMLKISLAHSLKVNRKIMGMSRKILELIVASNLNTKLVCARKVLHQNFLVVNKKLKLSSFLRKIVSDPLEKTNCCNWR